MTDIIKIVQYIVRKSADLKNKYTTEYDVPVEFACVFCQTYNEYKSCDNLAKSMGRLVEDTKNGFTYFLDKPINTISGQLRFLKIRKPDSQRKERGDADFNTDYEVFKEKYRRNPKFELVKRDNFEMLRLTDPDFDVMACFSNTPKSKALGIKF